MMGKMATDFRGSMSVIGMSPRNPGREGRISAPARLAAAVAKAAEEVIPAQRDSLEAMAPPVEVPVGRNRTVDMVWKATTEQMESTASAVETRGISMACHGWVKTARMEQTGRTEPAAVEAAVEVAKTQDSLVDAITGAVQVAVVAPVVVEAPEVQAEPMEGQR